MNRTNDPRKAIVDVDSTPPRGYATREGAIAAAKQDIDRSEKMIEDMCVDNKNNQRDYYEAHS